MRPQLHGEVEKVTQVTDNSVLVSGVSHNYGRRPALADVSLTLPVGVTGLQEGESP